MYSGSPISEIPPGWTTVEQLRDNLVEYMMLQSTYSDLANEPMPQDMINEMEKSMTRFALALYHNVINESSWTLLVSGQPVNNISAVNPLNLVPGTGIEIVPVQSETGRTSLIITATGLTTSAYQYWTVSDVEVEPTTFNVYSKNTVKFEGGDAIDLTIDTINKKITFDHEDTSSVIDITSDNSGYVVIQDISLGFDGFGHVTSGSVNTIDLASAFDNYGGWSLWVDSVDKGNIATGEVVNFIGGTNVTLSYNATNNAITINASGTGATTFLGLTDTPSTYSGAGGYLVAVNSTPNALEFIAKSSINLSSFNNDLTYDNYGGWSLYVNSVDRGNIASSEIVNFVAGDNVTLGYSATNNTITINATGTGGVTSFLGLSDTPSTYSGSGGYFVVVNSTPNALEFVAKSSINLSAFNNDLTYDNYQKWVASDGEGAPVTFDVLSTNTVKFLAGGGLIRSLDSGNKIITYSHADTSSVANLTSDNTNGVVLQDITFTFDGYGHTTAASVGTVDLDNRYSQIGHTHNYDNYVNWTLYVNTVNRGTILTTEIVDFVGSGGIDITYTTTNDNTLTFTLNTSGDWTGTFDGQEGSYYLDYNNLTNKPTINNYNYWTASDGSGTPVTFNVLSTNTVKFLVGSGLTRSLDDINKTITYAHADTSSASGYNSDNANGVVIQDITLTLDGFGHATAATVGTVDLDLRYSLLGHTHSYDNYGGWVLYVDDSNKGTISSGEIVNIKAGSGITLGYSATNNTITITSATSFWTNSGDTYGIHNVSGNVGIGANSQQHNALYVTGTGDDYVAEFHNTDGSFGSGMLVRGGGGGTGNTILTLQNNDGGGTNTFRFYANGWAQFIGYGSGSKTGSLAYMLGVDVSGNIIETTGGSSYWTSDGNGIHNVSGNVGVGADSLINAKFHSYYNSTYGYAGYFWNNNNLGHGILISASSSSGAYPLQIQTYNAGDMLLQLQGTGQLHLNNYGVSTFTGTPAYYLAVTSSGAVIETTAAGSKWSDGSFGIYRAGKVGVGAEPLSYTQFYTLANAASIWGGWIQNTHSDGSGLKVRGAYGVTNYSLYVTDSTDVASFSVRGDGRIFLNRYGAGAYTGAATKDLKVTAGGDVIETTIRESLATLTDCSITSPVNGQFLKYNGTYWVNADATFTAALTYTYVGVGNISNQLSGSAELIYDPVNHYLRVYKNTNELFRITYEGTFRSWFNGSTVPYNPFQFTDTNIGGGQTKFALQADGTLEIYENPSSPSGGSANCGLLYGQNDGTLRYMNVSYDFFNLTGYGNAHRFRILSTATTLSPLDNVVIIPNSSYSVTFSSSADHLTVYILVNRSSGAVTTSTYNALNGSTSTSVPANSTVAVVRNTGTGSGWYQIY